MWGWHYSLIRAIKEVMDKAGLSLDKAKSFVEAYAWDRTRTIEAACENARGELPQPLDLKSKMSTKEWLEIREAIEAEPDLEIYRCEKVQLYMYLRSRSKRYENLCKRGEARIRRRH
jgi:hypothetical protein